MYPEDIFWNIFASCVMCSKGLEEPSWTGLLRTLIILSHQQGGTEYPLCIYFWERKKNITLPLPSRKQQLEKSDPCMREHKALQNSIVRKTKPFNELKSLCKKTQHKLFLLLSRRVARTFVNQRWQTGCLQVELQTCFVFACTVL